MSIPTPLRKVIYWLFAIVVFFVYGIPVIILDAAYNWIEWIIERSDYWMEKLIKAVQEWAYADLDDWQRKNDL